MQFADVACALKTQTAIVVLAVRLGTLFFFNQNVRSVYKELHADRETGC